MDAYRIEGGRPLRGRIAVNGSKNASLPCLYASLLTPEPVSLRRVPNLRDTRTAAELLGFLGKKCAWDKNSIRITEGDGSPRRISDVRKQSVAQAPYELVSKMRASVLSAGPLLARFGKTLVALPGGCAIGVRPIDIHLKGFKAMGASVKTLGGDILISAPPKGLRPVKFKLPFPSVGATENLLLAASLIPGTTVLEGAAREPEIDDLAHMLFEMGATIEGIGSSKLTITGRRALNGVSHSVIADRIETGTLAVFAASVGGSDLILEHCDPNHVRALLSALQKAGVQIEEDKNSIRVRTPRNWRPRAVGVITKPYPGFPTDLQPIWMAFLTRSKGSASIKETIFENRFIHVAEMSRMGADIRLRGDAARVYGVPELTGAHVMASDLRAGAGLIAAALAAKGETVISRIYHVERGYENLEQNLASVGAKIKRFTEIKYQVVSASSR